MVVEALEVERINPFEEGRAFGDAGAYERIDAVVKYAVDPEDRANRGIVDLARAERDDDGLVRFSGDAVILRPEAAASSSRIALVDLPNRGRRMMTTLFNRAVADVPPTAQIPVGDEFLMRHGFVLAWCGWQFDVERGPGRMGLVAPTITRDLREPGWMQLRLQLQADSNTVSLADQHVGPIDAPAPVPTCDVADPDAVLYVHDRLDDEPTVVPRSSWRFADPVTLVVDGGLQAGRIYDLVYRVDHVVVVGAGMLATRDFTSFVRSARSDNPVQGYVDQVVLTGLSQNSRLIRHLLHLGLDVDETGRPAFDGALALVGGARRGEFNHRFAQPSVQPTPSFGHLFPFADDPQDDPRTGDRAGLLDAVLARPRPPKIIFADSSSEYWRGDASLAHTSVLDGTDVDDAPFVRRYLFSSAPHVVGEVVLGNLTTSGVLGANSLNLVDYRPLYRNLLMRLIAWFREGVEPPPSEVPRRRDGTGVAREEVLAALAGIPGMELPDPGLLPVLRALDLGLRAADGIGHYPASPIGRPYPCIVSAVDDDGNERAGIAMPDISVPVATHLGFNPRHTSTGGVGQLIEYYGSSIPFAKSRSDRIERSDPRPSIEERYVDRKAYLGRVRRAADALVSRGHLLAHDVELCVEIAGERFDAVVGLSERGGDGEMPR